MSRRIRTDEALRRLRRDAPVSDERLAAPWHASSAKRVMLEELGAEPAEAELTAMRPHRGGRRRGALLLSAVLTVAALGGTAVASGVFRPDPRDAVKVVNQGQAAEGSMHAPGWRTELDAERVQCFYGDGQGERSETTASAGALDADLRVEDLVAACAMGGRVDPRAAKLCALPAGPLRRNPKPVLLGFDGPCEGYGLDNADRFVEVDTERLLADINLRRQARSPSVPSIRNSTASATPSPRFCASSSDGSPPPGSTSRSAPPAPTGPAGTSRAWCGTTTRSWSVRSLTAGTAGHPRSSLAAADPVRMRRLHGPGAPRYRGRSLPRRASDGGDVGASASKQATDPGPAAVR
jgi:hypothetical protein